MANKTLQFSQVPGATSFTFAIASPVAPNSIQIASFF